MSLMLVTIHPSWEELLTENFMCKIKNIECELQKPEESVSLPLAREYPFFPQPDKVMRFLAQDLRNIKCIVLGMDPYASYYLDSDGAIMPIATGRSFEVADVTNWQQKFKQSSLRNILKTVYYNETGSLKSMEEIRNEISTGEFPISDPHEWFDKLEQQGVLFLNATLTVEPGHPDSHAILWKSVMDDIIRYINRNPDIKWLLFGSKAQERVQDTIGDTGRLYKCCHPRLPAFVDENIFQYVPEIHWIC